MSETILVVGGTGMLGRPVAKALHNAGYNVRVLSHNPEKAVTLFDNSIKIVSGNIEDLNSLKQAMEGCHGVHINLQGGPEPEDYLRVEFSGSKNVVLTAKKLGVKHITYTSGASVDESRTWFMPTRAKYLAEQEIFSSGIDYTVFRPSWFYESLPLFIRGNKAAIIGKQPNKFRWLSAPEYGEKVVLAYQKEEARNKVFTMLGPEAMTMNEAMERYVKKLDLNAAVSNAPIWLLSIVSTITFNKGLKNITRLMKYFETNGDGRPSDPEADSILGPMQQTLEQWCENQ